MKLIPVILSSLLAMPAFATINIQFDFANLRGAGSPGTPLVSTTLAVLIADSDGDGQLPTSDELQDAVLAANQSIAGDIIFFAGLTTGGSFGSTALNLDYTSLGVAQNDAWGLYWFPGLSMVGATAAAGQIYGAFQTSTLDQATVDNAGATDAMKFPGDSGQTVVTAYYDSQYLSDLMITPTVNSPSPTAFSANLMVVPEPSAGALGAICCCLFAALWRQRGAL
jgi:hypothetical protein